VQNVYNLTF